MKKTGTILTAIAAAAIVTGALTGYVIYDHNRKEKSLNETLESLQVEVDESLLDIEYGDTFIPDSIVKSHEGSMIISSAVSTRMVGDMDVDIKLHKKDKYNQIAEKTFSYTAHVRDTKNPEIVLKADSVSITEGDSFDPCANIESVKDPVDGDLKKADSLDKGTYTVEDETDPDTPGEYKVTVTAMDVNGNKSSAEYTVTVEETSYIPVTVNNDYPYYIRINRALNCVTVYTAGDDGSYSVPYKAFVCSTGDATPLGTYNTTAKYRWLSLYGGVYGQYATRIVGAILFHSVPYFTENPGDLEYEEYNKLGTAASLGCVRLCVRDVLWIYENCPVGTTVEFYDDYSSPGPLGKPVPLTIDTSSDKRGWDPTDPDPSNPWNN